MHKENIVGEHTLTCEHQLSQEAEAGAGKMSRVLGF